MDDRFLWFWLNSKSNTKINLKKKSCPYRVSVCVFACDKLWAWFISQQLVGYNKSIYASNYMLLCHSTDANKKSVNTVNFHWVRSSMVHGIASHFRFYFSGFVYLVHDLNNERTPYYTAYHCSVLYVYIPLSCINRHLITSNWTELCVSFENYLES